ncbi:MAG: hypothetical protein QG570_226 [Patescibacteria group bacterium]|nr:hypothetical protein [Patescibacteria group bacterium]
MADKFLVAPREHKCIGCNLCTLLNSVYENRKLGIKDSSIVIKGRPGRYKIQIDYGSKIKFPEKIVKICPQNCFEVVQARD